MFVPIFTRAIERVNVDAYDKRRPKPVVKTPLPSIIRIFIVIVASDNIPTARYMYCLRHLRDDDDDDDSRFPDQEPIVSD